jgi:tetratricopeptide (TPR) repeat protein
MAKKKRITRKELLKEPDEFLTFSAKTIRFTQEHQNLVFYTFIGLVVLVLGFFAFRYFSAVSERKAYALFEEGLVHYRSQGFQTSSDERNDLAKEKFGEIIEKYGSSAAARLALPLFADAHYRSGAYDQAIGFYRKALNAFGEEQTMLAVIWNDLGYAYEGKKDHQSALDCFQEVIALEGDFLKADAYFNVGRMHEALNQDQKALEAFEKVVNDYPNSVHGKLAEEKLKGLKG